MPYIIVAIVFIVLSLRPLKESAAYRFRKQEWNLPGFTLLGIGVLLLAYHSIWLIVVGAVVSFYVVRMKFN